jgi:hypothetical protein
MHDAYGSTSTQYAVGGIAAGIGAIWTAVVTRYMARATEQSVSEQIQSLREQNERARINFAVDLLYKLDERWDSQLFRNYRLRGLRYTKENYFVDDDILEVDHLDPDTEQIFDFFEEVGYLTRIGVLQLERVSARFGGLSLAWALYEPAVKKARQEWNDPSIYEDMEYLVQQIGELNRQIGVGSEQPTKEELRRFVEENLLAAEAGKEAPAGGEEPTKE